MALWALNSDADLADDADSTDVRRVRLPGTETAEASTRDTAELGPVDPRLLAMARGEIEPPDVFGLFVRAVQVPGAESEDEHARDTAELGYVDPHLLAISRGEIEPGDAFPLLVLDDPFGDRVCDDSATAVLDEDWLIEDAAPEPPDPSAARRR